MTASSYSSAFVEANGIRLHYLDWGGAGPVMLLLAGMGCNAYIFTHLAPFFSDRYRVLALTRRGHGDSDHPEDGYDLDTLVEDIHQFLDVLDIGPVILAGHSLAGVELGRFAARYPERVQALIYLDAGFDRASAAMKALWENNPLNTIQPPGLDEDVFTVDAYIEQTKRAFPNLAAIWNATMDEQSRHEVMMLDDGRVVDRMSEAISQALVTMMRGYSLEDRQIRAPVLSLYAHLISDYVISRDFMTEEQIEQVRAFVDGVLPPRRQAVIQEFQHKVPQAEIIDINPGHHYCFLLQEEAVVAGMNTFLLRHALA